MILYNISTFEAQSYCSFQEKWLTDGQKTSTKTLTKHVQARVNDFMVKMFLVFTYVLFYFLYVFSMGGKTSAQFHWVFFMI